MISIVEYPIGHTLHDSELEGEITDSGGDALVTTVLPHGLGSNVYVFIQSNVSSYNGYRVVTQISPTEFKISNTEGFIEYIHDSPLTYRYSIADHGNVAVHNPIVYELESDLYPTNTAEESYTPAAVTSHSNENGYTKLTLSGNISDATPLAWITVGNEQYQIISVISDSIVVINHAYDAADSFTGPVVKYYNNYSMNVEVWVGYDSTHPWASVKPYERAITLRFTPDDNNRAKFSISDIVKSYITTRNKTDLDTLPNNTDFSAGFYIVYYESYDESDGLEVTTHIGSSTTQDEDEWGFAVNAMLPFKSVDAGFMSDYLTTEALSLVNRLGVWLMLQDSMTWIVGKYMDISFFLADYSYLYPTIEVRVGGDLVETLDNPGIGIIRIPLTFDTAGEKCVSVWKSAIAERGLQNQNIAIMENCDGATWTTGSNPSVTLACCGTDSGYITLPFVAYPGISYEFSYQFEILASAGTPAVIVHMAFLDDDCNVLIEEQDVYFSTGVQNGTLFLNPSAVATKLGFEIRNTTLVNTKSFELQGITFEGSPALEARPLTEEYCITVVEECDSTIVPEDIRLLENGDYRILE